jgi:hypothetical protein
VGFLDRILGREPQPAERPGYGTFDDAPARPARPIGRPRADDDAAAIERYRYLLRTAPPDQVEQAHREAFSQLTPEQRQQVLTQLGSQVPESERATSDDPQSLARMATRAEMRRPGTLERSFGGGMGGGGMGGGIGMGGLIAGSLLASVAGAFVGTAIADAMFDGSDESADSADGGDSGDGGDAGSGDAGAADSGSSVDSGGSTDTAGDFGGGDFGDFGGGDFGGGDF